MLIIACSVALTISLACSIHQAIGLARTLREVREDLRRFDAEDKVRRDEEKQAGR